MLCATSKINNHQLAIINQIAERVASGGLGSVPCCAKLALMGHPPAAGSPPAEQPAPLKFKDPVKTAIPAEPLADYARQFPSPPPERLDYGVIVLA